MVKYIYCRLVYNTKVCFVLYCSLRHDFAMHMVGPATTTARIDIFSGSLNTPFLHKSHVSMYAKLEVTLGDLPQQTLSTYN